MIEWVKMVGKKIDNKVESHIHEFKFSSVKVNWIFF